MPIGDRDTIDVVVPTYRRAEKLERCLASLDSQSVSPDNVVVVTRREDEASQDVVQRWRRARPPLVRGVIVDEPGVIAAMSAGVSVTRHAIVAFTDDDAAPKRNWIEKLLEAFRNPSIGAVGGRDIVNGQGGPLRPDVGYFTWYGRRIGNHHIGCGAARPVQYLKGVNMAYRTEALGFPRAGVLRGSGAQIHFEILMGEFARRQGWQLLYDPSIVVDHDVGLDDWPNDRLRVKPQAVSDIAFNYAMAASASSGHSLNPRGLYGLAVGTRGEPGLIRLVAAIVRGEEDVIRRAPSAMRGYGRGWIQGIRGVDLSAIMVSADSLRASVPFVTD